MTRLLQTFLTLTIIASVPTLLCAAGGHDMEGNASKAVQPHIATEQEILSTASKYVLKMVGFMKVDRTWLSAKHLKTEKKQMGDHVEWVVGFENESVNEAAKKRLYIFLNLQGEVVAANYTGE